jgi:hypothetical protein
MLKLPGMAVPGLGQGLRVIGGRGDFEVANRLAGSGRSAGNPVQVREGRCGGFEADCTLHAVPFHATADGPAPTASQNIRDTHDTPSQARGCRTGDHLRVPVRPVPHLTAAGADGLAEGHRTNAVGAFGHGQPATRMSICILFLAILRTGTLRKPTAGPMPSGSMMEAPLGRRSPAQPHTRARSPRTRQSYAGRSRRNRASNASPSWHSTALQ